jgi:hypothetical protein
VHGGVAVLVMVAVPFVAASCVVLVAQLVEVAVRGRGVEWTEKTQKRLEFSKLISNSESHDSVYFEFNLVFTASLLFIVSSLSHPTR